jgi:hypothetical protein
MVLNIIHLERRKDRWVNLEKQLSEQNIVDFKIWEGNDDVQNPKRGIARAHKQIVNWAKSQNLSSVIIAEDDIKFTSQVSYWHFLQNDPEEYDLYLGGIIYGKINSNNLVNDFSGLHLYIIKSRFYDTFLSMPEELDLDRSLAGKGIFKVCYPMVAIQKNAFSDNQRKNQSYVCYLSDKELFTI